MRQSIPILAAIAILAGCDEFPVDLETPDVIPASSVSISIQRPRQISIGDVVELSAVIDIDGSPVTGLEVGWSSDRAEVFDVQEWAAPVDADSAEALAVQLSATGIAVSGGVARITIRVESPAFEAAVYSDTIRVMQRWLAVSAGAGQTCGVNFNQLAMCWGTLPAPLRVLGSGVVELPDSVSAARGAESVSVGAGHGCAVVVGGFPFCWGENVWGALGNGTRISSILPSQVPSADVLVAISAGGQFTCGVLSGDRRVACWGRHTAGQLGFPGTPQLFDVCTPDRYDCLLSPGPFRRGNVPPACVKRDTDFFGCLAFETVSTGEEHACGISSGAIDPAGVFEPFSPARAYCWGNNETGELGAVASGQCDTGDAVFKVFPCSPHAVEVEGGHAFTGIHAGGGTGSMTVGVIVPSTGRISGGHTCGLTESGALYCWGMNNVGQLGVETSDTCTYRPVDMASQAVSCARAPVRVAPELTFRSVSLGNAHTCALTSDDRAYCWGEAEDGQLGADGPETCTAISWATVTVPVSCARTPQPIESTDRFASINVGAHHTCAVRSGDGAIFCWGRGEEGQLGDGRLVDSQIPVRVEEPR